MIRTRLLGPVSCLTPRSCFRLFGFCNLRNLRNLRIVLVKLYATQLTRKRNIIYWSIKTIQLTTATTIG